MNQLVNKRICPKCKKGLLDTRVPRQRVVKLFLGWAPIKRYKCFSCNRKAYVWERQHEEANET